MAANFLPPYSYLVECFDYDLDTGILRWKIRPERHFNWNRKVFRHVNNSWAGKRAGVSMPWSNGKGAYLRVMIDRRYWAVHRVIWKLVTCFDPINDIDHIDGNGLNNQWNNLREATKLDNTRNRASARSKHFHLPKGVYWNPQKSDHKKYAAAITVAGTRKHIGYYMTPEEAHEAYCQLAKELHGEFFNSGHQLET